MKVEKIEYLALCKENYLGRVVFSVWRCVGWIVTRNEHYKPEFKQDSKQWHNKFEHHYNSAFFYSDLLI